MRMPLRPPAAIRQSQPARAAREGGHAALGAGLEVGRLGIGRHAGRLRGHAVELAHLDADHVDEADLGAGGDVAAGAHVGDAGGDGRDERAAGLGELVEDDPGEHLGEVEDAGREDRHRRRRAGERHGQDEERHAAVDELETGLGHLLVVLQRRDGAVAAREVGALGERRAGGGLVDLEDRTDLFGGAHLVLHVLDGVADHRRLHGDRLVPGADVAHLR